MEENLTTAITVMIVGMLTVFSILSLIVVSGFYLIRVVNYFHKEEVKTLSSSEYDSEKQLTRKKLAVITAVVQKSTGGKGKITRIEKI